MPITAIQLGCSQPCIRQLFPVWQVMQALQPEDDQELLGGNKGVGRAVAARAGTGGHQPARVQPTDQVAADLLAKISLRPSRMIGW